LANNTFTLSGFTNAANNGTFTSTASSSTTLTLNNTAGVAETHSGSAASDAYNVIGYPYPAVSAGAKCFDILKGDTLHSLATCVPGTVFPINDDGSITPQAYTPPTRNSTGDLYVPGALSTAKNILDDGSGNMTAANEMSAPQFCIGSNCVTSLYSNPMTTLGDVLYGGANGAAARLGGNSSTTPMYLKSVGASGAATAPTLAQIQFSDLAGTLSAGQLPVPSDLGTLTYVANGTTTFAAASSTNAAGIVTATHSTSTTLSPTGLVKWGSYVLEIKQDSTGGGATFTLGTSGACSAWKMGGAGGGAITLSTGAGALDFLAWTFDGTNCVANFRANFN
jgi:hypothetical protein